MLLHCSLTMVAIKVKIQKRASARAKYETIVITLPKEILEAASPKFKTSKQVYLDVDKGNITVKPA